MYLDEALKIIDVFASSDQLTTKIAKLEANLQNRLRDDVITQLASERLVDVLTAALAIKAVAGQINVVIHTIGILVSLPHVLEHNERLQRLSLGAGNAGRSYDLETDRQIAEFKFIAWRGRDTIRQNSTFVDLFNLASADSLKRRVLYVLDKEYPLKFLTGGRALKSILSKNSTAEKRFRDLHGNSFLRVRDYYATVKKLIEIVDLRDVVPAFKKLQIPTDVAPAEIV